MGKAAVWTLIVLLLLAGCDPQGKPKGHYEGTLLTRRGADIFQFPVGIDFSYDKGNSGFAAITNDRQGINFIARFSGLTEKSATLSIPTVMAEPRELKVHGDCLINAGEETVRVCLSGDRVFIEISNADGLPIFLLTADHFKTSQEPKMEDPVNMTVSDAVDRALAKNYDSRIEFERVIQAKGVSKAAYLNLLPHVSINSALSLLPPAGLGLIASVGDLAPFLLPSRWFQAKTLKEFSKAEEDSYVIMRADTATLIEGLAYSLIRDAHISGYYQDLENRAEELREQVKAIEDTQGLPEGSTDHLDFLINQIAQEVDDLQNLVKAQKAALAQALGFYNPEAVNQITIDNEILPIDRAIDLSSRDVTTIAVARAFEIRQIDHLIEAARHFKKVILFNWLDPSGDPSMDLGLSLGPNLTVNQSHIRELTLRREQLHTIISQKVYTTVNDYNKALRDLHRIKQACAIQERRFKVIIGQIKPGSGLNTIDVAGISQDYPAAQIRLIDVITRFRIARSRIDRFLLQGYYTKLWSAAYEPSPGTSN